MESCGTQCLVCVSGVVFTFYGSQSPTELRAAMTTFGNCNPRSVKFFKHRMFLSYSTPLEDSLLMGPDILKHFTHVKVLREGVGRPRSGLCDVSFIESTEMGRKKAPNDTHMTMKRQALKAHCRHRYKMKAKRRIR